MQRQPLNLSHQLLEVLSYCDSLLTRWALRKNSYLFKHLKTNLEIPLYIIAEERKIAQITQSNSVIVEALKLSDFVEVNEEARLVKLHQLPTLRFSDSSLLLQAQQAVKQNLAKNGQVMTRKSPEYSISPKNEEGFYYLVLKTTDPVYKTMLEEIGNKISNNLCVAPALYEDLKDAHQKLKKYKKDQSYQYGNKNNSYSDPVVSNPVYSQPNTMMPWMYYQMYANQGQQQSSYSYHQPSRTYNIFIRKAVESDDDDDDEIPYQKFQQNTQKQVEKTGGDTQKQVRTPNKQRKYDMKQNQVAKNKKKQERQTKNKVKLDDNDFPSIG